LISEKSKLGCVSDKFQKSGGNCARPSPAAAAAIPPSNKNNKDKIYDQEDDTGGIGGAIGKSKKMNDNNKRLTIGAESTTSDSGNNTKSKKVQLEKGYSLMDWIRYTKTVDASAAYANPPRRITHEELAEHNSEHDCWMAIQDKVFNVTAYMKFHPGGVDELMRGAGMNATKLFNDVHPWVNFASMLERLCVGVLVAGPAPSTATTAATGTSTSSGSQSKLLVAPSTSIPMPLSQRGTLDQEDSAQDKESKGAKSSSIVVLQVKPAQQQQQLQAKASSSLDNQQAPTMDSYQTIEQVNLVIYTKCKMLYSNSNTSRYECLSIDKLPTISLDNNTNNNNNNDNNDASTNTTNENKAYYYTLVLHLYVLTEVFKYCIPLPGNILDKYKRI
jgi:cytochrome b involved in lipid metabolism